MFNIWDILSSLQLPLYYMMLFLGALAAFIMLNVLMKKGGFSKFVKVRVRRSLFWAAVLATGCSTVANWFFHNGLDVVCCKVDAAVGINYILTVFAVNCPMAYNEYGFTAGVS